MADIYGTDEINILIDFMGVTDINDVDNVIDVAQGKGVVNSFWLLGKEASDREDKQNHQVKPASE